MAGSYPENLSLRFGHSLFRLRSEAKLLMKVSRTPLGTLIIRSLQYIRSPVGLSLHECVGVVVESASSDFQEGDFVLALPFDQYGFFEYLTLPESRIFPLPEEPVSKQEILMAQPLGTLLFAWRA